MVYLCYKNWWDTTSDSEIDGNGTTTTTTTTTTTFNNTNIEFMITSENQCSINFLQLICSTFFSYLIIIILIYRKCCIKQKIIRSEPTTTTTTTTTTAITTTTHINNINYNNNNNNNRKNPNENINYDLYRYHVVIWLLQLTLILCFSISCSENIIIFLSTISKYITIHLYFRLLNPISFIIYIILSSILFHHSESTKTPKYLWINIITLLITSILSVFSLHIHLKLGLNLEYVKVIVETCCALISVVLAGLFALSFIHEIKHRKHTPSIELKDVKYLHYYSTLLSRLTFYWFTAILWLGYRQPLEEEDLGDLPKEEHSRYQLERFQKIYEAEKTKVENSSIPIEFSLWKCLFKTLWVSLIIGGFFRLAADFAGFVAPLGIRTIVEYIGRNNTIVVGVGIHKNNNNIMFEHLSFSELLSNGYIMAIVVLLSGILQSTFSQCSTFLVNSEGIHIKIALQALVYKKSLTLSPTKASQVSEQQQNKSDQSQDDDESGNNSLHSSSGFDSGSIVNIMSEDTNNVMMFFWMAHFIWAIPLKLAILMVLLYFQLGYSALIGAGICILIMIPLQFLIGKKMSSNSKELMERCDERLRSVSEILQGMKLLKLHGWELIFTQQVSSIRMKEMKNLDKDLLYRSIMTFLTHISSVLVTVVTFGLYPYIESEKLEPSKVFAGLALFNQLTVPLFIFPITVPVVIDALVSTRRVKEFLLMPEAASLSKDEEDKLNENGIDGNGGGEGEGTIENGGFKDTMIPSTTDSRLIDISLNVPSSKKGDIQASSDSVFTEFDPIAEDEEENEDDEDEDEDDGDNMDDENLFDNKKNKKILNTNPNTNTNTNTTIPLNNIDIINVVDEQNKPKENLIENAIVSIHTGHFSWEEDRHDHTLQDIFTQIPKEKLTIIVGSIGSGKTSLVSAILGEMRVVSGEIKWKSDTRIAYAAQKPWILNASVRDNILFGKTFKPRRYKKVIEACSLQTDLDVLPSKDLTEIGEKGINLSGGQKQRVAIARALYSNANVVILDDPLSALDVEVAHNVFHSGIRKFLVRSRRAVILVTHHLPVLHHAHHIIAMEKGQIRIQGTLAEIQSQDPKLSAEWKEIMTKKEAELEKRMEISKTAKDRWSLVKNVSKFGLQLKHLQNQANWKKKNEDEGKAALEAYRKRKGTFSHYRNLSHDIFLPSDECHDEMMTPLLRRRCVSRTARESRTSASSSKHPQLARMSSLQVENETKNRSSPLVIKKFTRMQSLPVEDDGDISGCPEGINRNRSGTYDTTTGQRLWKRFKNAKKALSATKPLNSTGSSVTELEKLPFPPPPAQRLISTTSAVSSDVELPEDDGDGAEESLLNREHSQEEREYGTIPMEVYLSYISACGNILSGVYLFFSIGYEVVRVYTNFWLKEWSDEVHKSTDEEYEDVMSHYFNIYVILSIITVLVSLLSNLIGKQAGANSREKLHSRMLNRIIRCPMRFFDSTPIGRIINRFSSDIAVVDRKLCISMQRFLQFVFLCISAIIVNAIVNPWFLLVVLPVVSIYYFIQRFYRFSSRELQRIEAISRGPIYSHFHESLEGLSTIRAYKEQRRFTNQMLTKIDMNNRASMFMNVGNRWLSISLDYLGSVIVFLATLVSMVSSHIYPDVVTPSMVGLAINYTLLVPVYLNWVVKFLAEVEMFMNSVERIDRYAELEIEDYGDDRSNGSGSLPKNWPSNGQVSFENVSIQYGPDRPLIITNLNANVTSKEKVGLCGRSGSGKSSLLMALFRMSDVAQGKIYIDGVDIHNIPLLKLRSSLSIIPQENILFSGTIRFNLDPENKVSDADIWNALSLSQMKETIDEMPGQLYADVKDGGSNFSAGQKQLLGLARAILHKSKIIIMDEATSSVDLATERTLLEVVKDVFKDSTVLTIAHRLDTIIDGDRVLVLDAGILVEDGNPSKLVHQPRSNFAQMIKSSNEQNQSS